MNGLDAAKQAARDATVINVEIIVRIRLPAPLAADALKLELATDNSLARVQVRSRAHAGDDANAWQAWTEGVDYFLAKPFDADELLRYLDYLFQGSALAG